MKLDENYLGGTSDEHAGRDQRVDITPAQPRSEDYKDILRSYWTNIHSRNHRYSLRSFARLIGISSGRLSEVLSGKQGLSARSAEQIAQRLKMAPDVQKRFVCLVVASCARSRRDRLLAQKELEELLKKQYSSAS